MTARAVTLIKLYILTIVAIWYDDWWNIGQWQLRIVTVRFELVSIKSHQIIHLIWHRWAYFRWVCQFTLSFHHQQSNSDYFVVRMSKNEFHQLRKPFSFSLPNGTLMMNSLRLNIEFLVLINSFNWEVANFAC